MTKSVKVYNGSMTCSAEDRKDVKDYSTNVNDSVVLIPMSWNQIFKWTYNNQISWHNIKSKYDLIGLLSWHVSCDIFRRRKKIFLFLMLVDNRTVPNSKCKTFPFSGLYKKMLWYLISRYIYIVTRYQNIKQIIYKTWTTSSNFYNALQWFL